MIINLEKEAALTDPDIIGEVLRDRLIYDSITAMEIAVKLDPEYADSYYELSSVMSMSRNIEEGVDIQKSEYEKWEKKSEELRRRNREKIRKNPPAGIPAHPKKKAA